MTKNVVPNVESPLTQRIRWVLTHAREAWDRKEPNKRKWSPLPNGGEIHIQFKAPNVLRMALARVGSTPTGNGLKMLNNELDTLINYWPEEEMRETGERKLVETDESGRYWLVTTLTIAKQLELL